MGVDTDIVLSFLALARIRACNRSASSPTWSRRKTNTFSVDIGLDTGYSFCIPIPGEGHSRTTAVVDNRCLCGSPVRSMDSIWFPPAFSPGARWWFCRAYHMIQRFESRTWSWLDLWASLVVGCWRGRIQIMVMFQLYIELLQSSAKRRWSQEQLRNITGL